MNRIVPTEARQPQQGRAYRSELRTQQTEETRSRILDATVRVLARGLASLSIPAVAREAGVSVPTVYRHFATKADLLSALYPHLARRAGFDSLAFPGSVDELRDGVRAVFDRIEALDDLARAAVASPAADEARRATMPKRLEMARRFADTIEPTAAKADRERIARLLVVLTSSSALRTWREYLGASVEQAAEDVEWVMRAAVAAASRRHDR